MGCTYKRGRLWWIKYFRDGRAMCESSHSDKKDEATRLLRLREGDIARGLPITPKIGRLRFEEAAEDIINDYRTNKKRSLDEVERRITLHLAPFFRGRRMASISTLDVRRYVAHRQGQTTITRPAHNRKRPDGSTVRIPACSREVEGASNAAINRELAILKRMFNLAVQADKLLHKPYVPMLRESNTRKGFFEPETFRSVLRHLPDELRPVFEFAYVTGWRLASEVLPLEWRQVDFEGKEIRLDPGTTKNDEARTFPFTNDLERLLEAQRLKRDQLKKAGHLVPWVFFRVTATRAQWQASSDRSVQPEAAKPKPITTVGKAWKAACLAAACPGRIPHDLRRTAIRNMVRRSVPERVAMKLSGHKTRSVFERYNIVSEGDLRDAARRLDGLTRPIDDLSNQPVIGSGRLLR